MNELILYDGNLRKEDTQKVETTIFNYRSKELYINLKQSDIPPYGHKDREDFIRYEEQKCLQGVTINGIFIPGTLYWDINHWAIMQDVVDNRGVKSSKAVRPDIRDNDWIIHNALYNAEKDRGNLVMGTARQISKSKNIASIFGCDLMLYDNRINLLMAGASVYLVPIMEYLFIGTENCTEFFRVPRLTRDKKAITVKWGFKTPQNEEVVKSMLHIRNAREGLNTEVSAGVTIHRAAIDEIATFPFRSSYETIKPALIGKDGIRSSSLTAFTGGNAEKSKDAEELFMNPTAGTFAEFENEGKKTGLFLGGWYRQDLKVEKNLGEWLKIEDKTSELYDLKVRVTDFDHANKVLDAEEVTASKSTDPTALTKQKMYNPRKIEDMFLTPDKNPFNIEALQRHKANLLANPIGVPITLYRDPNGEVKFTISVKKPISSYPVKDQYSDLDAPIMMYDAPKHTHYYDLHVIGFDPYNQDKTVTSDSLGSVYVMRRMHSDISDPFINCIVASYTARPNRLKEFFKNVELLQEFYNGSILFEHSGAPVVQYFEEKLKTHVLMDTYSLQREIAPKSQSSATKGLKATPGNKEYLLNLVIMYLEELLVDGSLGLTRIPDVMLLEELIAYDGDKNVDRYDAFAHALGNMYAKAKYNTRPFLTTFEKEEPKEEKRRRTTAFSNINSGFGAFGFNKS